MELILRLTPHRRPLDFVRHAPGETGDISTFTDSGHLSKDHGNGLWVRVLVDASGVHAGVSREFRGSRCDASWEPLGVSWGPPGGFLGLGARNVRSDPRASLLELSLGPQSFSCSPGEG